METKTIYVPVDCEVRLPKTEKPARTFVLMEDGQIAVRWHLGGEGITHWLERQEDMVVMTKDDFEAAKKKEYNKGHSEMANFVIKQLTVL